jgi:dihydrofolate reductase
MLFNLIVAICHNNGIGHNGNLPWRIKDDMKYFSKLTKDSNGENALIMGSSTWNSLPNKYLPGRNNLILSSTIKIHEIMSDGYIRKSFDNIDDIIKFCILMEYNTVWIIGGATIYKQFLDKDIISKCYITKIDKFYECDTFFPELNSDIEKWKLCNKYTLSTDDNINLEFHEYYNKDGLNDNQINSMFYDNISHD